MTAVTPAGPQRSASDASAPAGVIKAVVGLGNPGKQYAQTRHNVGFLAVERLAERLGASWSAKFNSLMARARLGDRELTLLEPQQFMNLSGHGTQAMAQFYGIKPAEILVVHDDLDLAFGRIQLKVGGGHGGHNGLRSLQAQLGDAGFARLRIGIGRPDGAKGGDEAVSNWVLSPFSPLERAELSEVLTRALAAVQDAVTLGPRPAMNLHNAVAKPATVGKTEAGRAEAGRAEAGRTEAGRADASKAADGKPIAAQKKPV